jgi:hypothetical protein
LDSSAHGLVRRWRLIGAVSLSTYKPAHLEHRGVLQQREHARRQLLCARHAEHLFKYRNNAELAAQFASQLAAWP